MLHALNHWLRRRQRRHVGPAQRRPQLEVLEDRAVPAGNVFAANFGGTLALFGDDLDNGIHVADGSQPGEVVVTGAGGTTINGAPSAVFPSIGALHAELFGGNDTLVTENLTVGSFGFALVFIDAGAGDDRVELIDTSIRAFEAIDVQIFGDRLLAGAAPTSGNDTIRLSGVTMSTEGFGFASFVNVDIYGEFVTGGEVTGGNDTIVVQDSVVRAASRGFVNIVTFDLVGNYSASGGGMTSVIGEGNDIITLSGTTLTADGSQSSNTVVATIIGDYSEVRSFPGGDAASIIGSGNDSITVQDTEISTFGSFFSSFNVSRLDVRGDWNLVEGSVDASASALVGGGNDRITVANTNVAASGEFGGTHQVTVDIAGDLVQLFGPLGSSRLSSIGGGNDRITVADTDIALDGSGGDFAVLAIDGERHENFDPAASFIGGGNDRVSVRTVQMIGHATVDTRLAFINTGVGNDRLEVLDSVFRFVAVDLGDGNDALEFSDNVFAEASLNGGLGIDRLTAHDNLGLLIFFAFEHADVSP
jgi:hypothetical protein